MTKLTKIITGVVIFVLVAAVLVEYQANIKLKNDAGVVYQSNIVNFSMHMNRIETYLKNEKQFNHNDLTSYNYEVNYLLTVRLPSNTYISTYLEFIQSGFAGIDFLVSKGAKKEQIESERDKTLQLVSSLKEALDKMEKAGELPHKNGIREDYKKYYELSLPDNKTMKAINIDLEKQFKKHLDVINKDIK